MSWASVTQLVHGFLLGLATFSLGVQNLTIFITFPIHPHVLQILSTHMHSSSEELPSPEQLCWIHEKYPHSSAAACFTTARSLRSTQRLTSGHFALSINCTIGKLNNAMRPYGYKAALVLRSRRCVQEYPRYTAHHPVCLTLRTPSSTARTETRQPSPPIHQSQPLLHIANQHT